MILQDLLDAMEQISPLSLAESWDKVGLQLGDPTSTLEGSVLLTIDLTERVLQEAMDLKVGAIIAYHPPIWKPLEALTNATHTQRIIRGAAQAGIAIFTPHTALDASAGGVTDWLCEGISAPEGKSVKGMIKGDCRALAPATGGNPDREVKVITFVPSEKVDHLRNALGTAGAGGIGNYRLCSFNTQGEGTFLPQPGAQPVIGVVGSLERVAETRIEMVCARKTLALVIETLKEFHPYETPAYDIVELVPEPIRKLGAGRRLVLDQPTTIEEIIQRLKAFLDRSRVRYTLAQPADHLFSTIAVVPGSGGSFTSLAAQEGCELLITGEMTHHELLAANQAGLSVLLAGHTNTERGYLPRLQSRLEELLPTLNFTISNTDHDEIQIS